MAKSQPFPRLRATAIDGRLGNVFIRQEQLKKLHSGLVQSADAILDAIIKDSGNTRAEAVVEYSLALASLKKQLAELDPEKELEDEYRVANGKDAADRREAIGIAYIEPTNYTFFYSVIVPLSVAIAAGNCVIVQIENSTKALPTLLQRTLSSCLDADIFATASSKPTDTAFLASCVHVNQQGSEDETQPLNMLSSARGSVVGIVDRTANLEEAAEALLTARFGFGGNSPYAPDIVLINEFIKKDFLNALIRKSIDFMTGRGSDIISDEKNLSNRRKQNPTIDLPQLTNMHIITTNSIFTIAETTSRTSPLLPQNQNQKQKNNVFLIHAVRSLDDAINLSTQKFPSTPLLATYIFASPASAKYLAQFIPSHYTSINHIPAALLLGPAAPLGFPASAESRYEKEQFTAPRAVFVQPSPQSGEIGKLLVEPGTRKVEVLLESARAEVKVGKGRPLKAAPFGFFDQGILTALVLVLGSGVLGVGGLGWYGMRVWGRGSWSWSWSWRG